MKESVRNLYLTILGREPDQEGWDYWTGLLNEKAISLDSLRWEFLSVRLAADKVALEAVIAKVDQGGHGGPTAAVVAEEAYRLFLDNLAALGARS